MPLLADEVFQEAKPDFTDGTADAPSDKKPTGQKVKATDYFRVVNPDPETFLGSFAKAAVEPFKALAKSPSMVTMDDDSWYEEIQKESVHRQSAGKSGLAATAGRIAGSVAGGVAEFTGSTLAASDTGPAAPFVGPAVAFGASGSWESAINAGVRAYDQGLPKDKVVGIAKKMAGVGAATGAGTAIALGATGLIPRTATALARTGATAAIGAGTGVGSQLIENVAEKDMGLDVSPTEGLLEQAVIMGLLPVVAHAKDLYRQARSVAKSDPAKAKALQQSADDVAGAELDKVTTDEPAASPEAPATAPAPAKTRQEVAQAATKRRIRQWQEARRAEIKAAKPTVPETPAEPEADKGISVIDEIKQGGARTVADIQRLFPQAQLSREAARKLRDQAWGKQEEQSPKSEVATAQETTKEEEAPAFTWDDWWKRELESAGPGSMQHERTQKSYQNHLQSLKLDPNAPAILSSGTGKVYIINKPQRFGGESIETTWQDLPKDLELIDQPNGFAVVHKKEKTNVTVPVTYQSSTGSAPNREPVAPTGPVEPKGKEENALVTETAQPVQPVREQPVSGKGEVPNESGLAPNDERGSEASQPETPAQPTTDPPTITADGPAGDWSYETLKALSVAQRGKLAGDLRRYTKDARLTDKAGLLELGPKKIAEVVKDLGARKLKEAQEKASKPVEAPPIEKPAEDVTTPVTSEEKPVSEQPPTKADASPGKEPESPSKPRTGTVDRLYLDEHADLIELQRQMEEADDPANRREIQRDRDDTIQRLKQFDANHGRDASVLVGDSPETATAKALRGNPRLTHAEAVIEGQRLIKQAAEDAAYDKEESESGTSSSPGASDQQLLIDVPKSPKDRTRQIAQLRRLADKLEEEYNREDISLDRSRQLQDRQDKILRKLHELESQSMSESRSVGSTKPSLLEFAKSKLPAESAAKVTNESQAESFRSQWEKEIGAKPQPPSSIPTPPEVDFQHPAEGSPGATSLNDKASALQKQVDESYSKMQQFKEQANNAGYGTKRKGEMTLKAEKARDQYDSLSKQYEPLREQRYQMTLEHVVRNGPPEAKLAAAVELLQRRKSPRFREESDKAYKALRTEAENRLVAGGVDSKTAEHEALGLVSSVMSYPASEFGWFEKRIPGTLDRLKEEKASDDRLAKAKALLEEYGVLHSTGFEAKVKAARDDAHFKALMDEERSKLKNEQAAMQKVEAEKAEILKEQISQELENAKQLQKEGKLFWRRWGEGTHSRWSPIEAKAVSLETPGDFFIYRGEKGWVVVESSTGLSVGNGKLRADAIADANSKIQTVGAEKFQKVVSQKAKEAGPKPDLSKIETKPISEPKPPEPPATVEAKPEVAPDKGNPLNAYLDSLGLDPMRRGKVETTLTQKVSKQSKDKTYTGTRDEVVRQMLSDGYVPKTEEVDAVKDVSRVRYNRMDGREQEAYEKRKAEAGKKTEYHLEKPDGSFFEVTKAEYDLATTLSNKPSAAAPAPDQKYRIGNNPSTYSLIERLPQSETEKANGEQPVRVKNDRTGVEETVFEQDLKPVQSRTQEEKASAKESKRDLDAELREAKMDPSVFPDDASKREALRRAKAKGWEKFSMRPDGDRSSLEKRIKQYGDTREVQDRNLIDQILRPTLEKQAGQKLVLDPATTGEAAQGRGELGAGVPGSIDARSTAAFERLFGKRLVFYRQSAEAAATAERYIYGYSTSRAADVIFVDADAPNTWLRVAGHELLHHINKERPDLYRELEDHFIKDAAGKQEQAFDKYSNYPPEEITEEAVADLVGDSVADPKFWDRFASKNPGLFWRAAKTMLDWLDKAAEWLKGTDFGSAEFTKDVDRARSVVADTLAKYSEGKQGEISADWEKFSAARPATPGTLPPEESKVRKVMDAAGDGLRKLRSTIAHSWVSGDIRRAFASTRDAGDTAASLFGRKMANEVRQPMLREYGKSYQQRAEDGLTFAVEAKGDINALNIMRDKILNSDKASPTIKRRAVGAIDFAFDQWETIQKHAEKYKAITDYQVQQENAKGIDTLLREGYVMHEQDVEFEPSIMTSRSGTGDATGFRKVREHDTYADSIAAGIDPKSLNAVDLLQARVRRGQQLINKRAWVDGLKTFIDPISHNPIATDPSIITRADGSKYPQAPDGYTLEMIQRQPIAIHKGYEGIISALTDPSAFSRSLGAQSLMKWAGAGKSISLMFDTFHLGRVAFWDSLIKATGVKTFRLPFPSYRKGLTLADYTTEQIRTMAAHGEIPADWVTGLEQEHSRLGHLVKGGYNIGRVSDSLYQDFIHNLPVVGKVNRWVFEHFQRGAMVETGLLEFERLKSARPDMPDADVGRQVARDLNTRFGNLGRQGLLKSRTFQDLARFLVLAPQWNEGLIRSELGAGKQAIQMVADLARGKSLYSGVLLRSVGGMALAQFTANQIINYITRGHPTWENPEEGLGAKLSAWIPDKLGSGSGFFLHPLGLAAETTHLLMRKFEQTGDFHSSLMNYLRSRSSTAMRPMMTFITNQDFLGRNLKPGTVWAQMAADAIPRPIGGQAYALGAKQVATGKESESFAGQFEKQILSSVGIKTEGAPAPASRISSLAREFNRQKGIVPSAEFYSGDYQPLTSAVALGNEDAAKDAMTELLKRKTPEQVRKYMATWTGHPFTGQRGREAQFRATLTPEQKEQYSKAIEQRRKVAQEVFRMLRERQWRTVQTVI